MYEVSEVSKVSKVSKVFKGRKVLGKSGKWNKVTGQLCSWEVALPLSFPSLPVGRQGEFPKAKSVYPPLWRASGIYANNCYHAKLLWIPDLVGDDNTWGSG